MKNKNFQNVYELLESINRPATSYEIVLLMEGKKNRNSVFSEIRSLIKSGMVKKKTIPLKGYKIPGGGDFTIYIRVKKG